MTTPSERFRALVYGAELLMRLQSEDVIPADLRTRAGRLELAYPTHARLVALLERPDGRLPRSIAAAVFEVGVLFESCGTFRGTSEDFQHLWLATMRHYPGRADGWHSPEALESIGVADLLRCDPAE